MLTQVTRSSGRHNEACALPLNLTEKLAGFALGVILLKELYFQITLAAMWRTDYWGARVNEGG